ncbi:amine oxidase [copper-containing] [Mizuhopecten yessoensis]|uniref:Amine oxidase n=1 Tax=Mizuhopecten yessoensis TaxID=6573 RepID=A0A210QB49_MIZYE|nr:amine oxidase [copper-containing] [Mizuhopecten yessoensis]
MTRRGQAFQNEFKRGPIEVEPNGKRYSIHHNHAEYMGWKFFYRMSSVHNYMTSASDQETAYGTQVHDHINGNLHTHLVNLKVDIDIKGRTNRFETWDIAPTTRPNAYSAKENDKYHMTKYTRDVKDTELAGAYKFNFETPKYLLFYNEQEKNAYGNPKAYRIVNRGMVKQLFAEGEGNEPAASWARYQVAVTKYQESERRSSSAYAYMDSSDPVVQFQNFIDKYESIVDEVCSRYLFIFYS